MGHVTHRALIVLSDSACNEVALVNDDGLPLVRVNRESFLIEDPVFARAMGEALIRWSEDQRSEWLGPSKYRREEG